MRRLLLGLIRIHSHHAEVFVEPCLAVEEMVWKMIMKTSGKS